MIRVFLAGLIFVAPAWAAEVVSITSGEHEGFARLVLRVDPSNDWSLKQGNHSAELIIQGADFTFNESNVFDRIARNRLLSTNTIIGDDISTFHLNLACTCKVKAYGYQGEYIVLDIFDSETSTNIQEAANAENVQRRAPQLWNNENQAFTHSAPSAISSMVPQAPSFIGTVVENAFPKQVLMPTLDTGILRDTLLENPKPDQMIEEAMQPLEYGMDQSDEEVPHHDESVDEHSIPSEERMVADTESGPHVNEDLAETVAMARTQLLQQLTMAAEMGLLDFDGPILATAAEEQPEEMELEPETIHREPEPTHPLDDRQLRVQSVYDRDAGAAEIMEMLAAHNNCPSGEILDIASWGSGDNFSEEVSAARTMMLREFDEPDLSVVSDLVHLYIRYGFGLEAMTYLNDYENLPNIDLLKELATVVDGKSVAMNGLLGAAVSCNGIVGVWALAGTYPDVSEIPGNIVSIANAFEELPIKIRRIFGPRLVLAFLGRGLIEEAAKFSDILERAPGDHGVEHRLSMADVTLEMGGINEAQEAYHSLANRNNSLSVDALIRLAELSLEQGNQMTENVLNDLGAAADEARGSSKGGELRRLEALWIAKLSGGRAALTMLAAEVERDSMNADKLMEASREVLGGMSAARPLDEYVTAIGEYSYLILEGREGYDVRAKVGRELLQSGLPNFAIQILQPSVDSDNIDGMQIAAEAYLDIYQPDLAFALLEGVKTDRARVLRIKASVRSSDFARAIKELNALHNKDLAWVDPGWFSGNWNDAAATDAAALELLNKYIHRPSNFTSESFLVVDDLATLADVQDVLDNSTIASRELAGVINDR